MKESILKVQNLTYKYDHRSIKGVESLEFDLKQGECLGLIGPSGSGKSTALKLIANILKPQSGVIEQTSKSNLSYVPQTTELPQNKTVLEILINELSDTDLYSDSEKQENQARSVLSLLNITNEINSKVEEISGGQKQRVIIAKALVKNPTILLLDEPFGHLDEKLRFELMIELFELFKVNHIAVLWVTHETKEALAFSDRIMVLNHGKIQQISTPETLYYRPQNFFTAQFMGKTNIIPLKAIEEKDSVVTTKLFSREIELVKPDNFSLKAHKDLILLIKPEFIFLDENGRFKAKVTKQIFQGSHLLTELTVANEFKIWIHTNQNYNFRQKVNFSINLDKVHLLNEF